MLLLLSLLHFLNGSLLCRQQTGLGSYPCPFWSRRKRKLLFPAWVQRLRGRTVTGFTWVMYQPLESHCRYSGPERVTHTHTHSLWEPRFQRTRPQLSPDLLSLSREEQFPKRSIRWGKYFSWIGKNSAPWPHKVRRWNKRIHVKVLELAQGKPSTNGSSKDDGAYFHRYY